MTFVLSKVLWLIVQPSNLLLLLLLLGVLLRWFGSRETGNALIGLIIVLLVIVALFPVGHIVARPLENRFPQADPLPASVDGIVVLGGAVDPTLTIDHGQPALNRGAERITALVGLTQRYPDARLVFTGGFGRLLGAPISEAVIARELFAVLGIDPARLSFEEASRNTYENAVFSKSLINPRPGETWLLVTSAQHMPRSVGVFRHTGWPVVPVPVDFNVPARPRPSFSLGGNLQTLDWAVREWSGLLAYRLMGRTEVLFPEP